MFALPDGIRGLRSLALSNYPRAAHDEHDEHVRHIDLTAAIANHPGSRDEESAIDGRRVKSIDPWPTVAVTAGVGR
jgi:hypothetical protein